MIKQSTVLVLAFLGTSSVTVRARGHGRRPQRSYCVGGNFVDTLCQMCVLPPPTRRSTLALLGLDATSAADPDAFSYLLRYKCAVFNIVAGLGADAEPDMTKWTLDSCNLAVQNLANVGNMGAVCSNVTSPVPQKDDARYFDKVADNPCYKLSATECKTVGHTLRDICVPYLDKQADVNLCWKDGVTLHLPGSTSSYIYRPYISAMGTCAVDTVTVTSGNPNLPLRFSLPNNIFTIKGSDGSKILGQTLIIAQRLVFQLYLTKFFFPYIDITYTCTVSGSGEIVTSLDVELD